MLNNYYLTKSFQKLDLGFSGTDVIHSFRSLDVLISSHGTEVRSLIYKVSAQRRHSSCFDVSSSLMNDTVTVHAL